VEAVEFYKAAFAAVAVFRLDGDEGSVVVRLSVDGAEFWVGEESQEHFNLSPASLGARRSLRSSRRNSDDWREELSGIAKGIDEPNRNERSSVAVVPARGSDAAHRQPH
jgi:hypothetical protein